MAPVFGGRERWLYIRKVIGEAAYPYTGPSGYECMPSYYSDAKGPFGRNNQAAESIRSALRANGLQTPVVVAGGVYNFERAEALLADPSYGALLLPYLYCRESPAHRARSEILNQLASRHGKMVIQV